MKKLIPIFVLFIVCFYSCKKEEKKTSVHPLSIPFNERPVPTLPNANNIATGVVGGAHYICPKKCKGGTSSAKGACPICSTELTHNQAFHNKPINTTIAPISTPVATPASGPNAKGEYHYKCKNGCAGGEDAAGKCRSCSSDLEHNTAYHS
ncbi:heavy metal-binding domain-containing protein [uncultured Tenacibaculum sp.]|uniref:heavy metal-binding domain-containing protein n=1 Tax=uncultured Tenacibaculum sp. TaxID=174713 RepID=UPI00263A2318|nr:heavy metal-binding domain-containing protein [uncultured Tenacibaculum sp.]